MKKLKIDALFCIITMLLFSFVVFAAGGSPVLGAAAGLILFLIVPESTRGFAYMALVPRQWANLPADNTSRMFTHEFSEPAYAATITSVLKTNILYIVPAALTGPLTHNITLTGAKDFDEVIISYSASGGDRVVTLGANFLKSGTITVVDGKTATIRGVVISGKVRIYAREISA